MTLPRLRTELTIEHREAGRFVFSDPTTGRSFVADEVQHALMARLDGTAGPAQLADEVLGDGGASGQVAAFIERLRAFGFLDEGLATEVLSQRQANASRRATDERLGLKLAHTIRWAARDVPLYRERFAGLPTAEVTTLEALAKLPTMTKRDVRANFPHRLLPDGVSMNELIAKGEAQVYATSGTTGDRLQTLYDTRRNAYPSSFPGIAPVEGGWSRARIALFTTPICSGLVCHMGATGFEERVSLDGHTVSITSSDRVMRLTRGELELILEDFATFKPTILRADPIYAVALIRALERHRLPLPKVEAVWTAYEHCSVMHRPILEAAFGVPVFTVYAATDLGGGCQAFRCHRGLFHVRRAQYIFEFLREGRAARPGEIGELAVTALSHRFLPLIRYRVEDLARPVERPCDCEHHDWPAFELEGRIRDCVLDTRGGIVTTRAVDALFTGLSWLDFYQLTQTGPAAYRVLGVRRDGVDEANDVATFRDRARGLFGADVDVTFKYVHEIPTEKSFKFRLTGSPLFQAPSEW